MSEAQNEMAPGHNKTYSIKINTREVTVTEHRLSFEEVVKLAFPNDPPDPLRIYTVTYATREGHDRSLVAGESVEIKNGMAFNVTKTNRS